MKDEKYSFIMIGYEDNELVRKIQEEIDENDLYIWKEDEQEYEQWLQEDLHVTLVACMDNDIKIDDLFEYLKPCKEYKAIIKNISLFENEKNDVLKFDVDCDNIYETHDEILKHYESHSEYKDYKPHMTIAYLKSWKWKKYIDKFSKYLEEYSNILIPDIFLFSNYIWDVNQTTYFCKYYSV